MTTEWEIPHRVKEQQFYIPPAPRPDTPCLDLAPGANQFGMKDFTEKLGYTYTVANSDPKENGVLKEDLCNLSFKDGAFGLVMCSHVLDRVESPMTACQQLFRVLDSEGLCILSLPCSFTGETRRVDHSKGRGFTWQFGYRQVQEMITQPGFHIGLEVVRPAAIATNYLAILHKGLPRELFVGALSFAAKLQERREKAAGIR